MEITPKLQRRILALLEEAGEENLTCLTNTVAEPRGAPKEIEAMRDALSALTRAGLIKIATSRDSGSQRWIPLGSEAAISLLQDLCRFVEWSVDRRFWQWTHEPPHAVALLTSRGRTMALRVLSEDGWPEQPLKSHE